MTAAAATELDGALTRYRPELVAYCYRMLGSSSEAEDAVQETMLRAWRGYGRFEGRSELRAWLYRIATNVCLDALQSRARRALPMDLGPAAEASSPMGPARPAAEWVEPLPDARLGAVGVDPADVVASRETIRLAFVAALQHLGARQRAVLILRDVLHWKAAEVAEILGTSADAVNSTLRRVRTALATADLSAPFAGFSDGEEVLLARYVDAFERFDVDALVALLRSDATVSMPPYDLWFRGRRPFAAWLHRTADICSGGIVIKTQANACPAFAVYQRPPDRSREPALPYAIHVLEPAGDLIGAVHIFLDPTLFARFGLPAEV